MASHRRAWSGVTVLPGLPGQQLLWRGPVLWTHASPWVPSPPFRVRMVSDGQGSWGWAAWWGGWQCWAHSVYHVLAGDLEHVTCPSKSVTPGNYMTFNTKADIQGPLGSDLLDVRASVRPSHCSAGWRTPETRATCTEHWVCQLRARSEEFCAPVPE